MDSILATYGNLFAIEKQVLAANSKDPHAFHDSRPKRRFQKAVNNHLERPTTQERLQYSDDKATQAFKDIETFFGTSDCRTVKY